MKRFLAYILLSFTIISLYSKVGIALPPQSFSDVVSKSMPAIVNISTSQKISKRKIKLDGDNPYEMLRELFEREFGLSPYGGGDEGSKSLTKRSVSLGSGFIIDQKGYIVTNNHVIEEADEINVTLSGDNTQYKAKLIGKDLKTDLALLKIDTEDSLPFLEFGDSDKSKVGDFILVIGNPFGLGGSVSAGIISAKARNINSGHYDDFIQTDAAINVGNSGGPMLNVEGEVIGVNSIILSPSKGNIGIGFAIPSSMVKYVVGQLKEKGRMVRGQLGITIQDIDKGVAEGLNLKGVKGALVGGIIKGSPAEKSGIKVGDVITKFNSKPITLASQLPRMVGEVELHKKVNLEILRDGKVINIQVPVEVAKEDEAALAKSETTVNADAVFGIVVQNLSDALIERFGLSKDAKGVAIVSVERDSLAHMSGIRPGDVIISANRQDVRNKKDFDEAVASIKKTGKGAVTFLVLRNEHSFFISLEENSSE